MWGFGPGVRVGTKKETMSNEARSDMGYGIFRPLNNLAKCYG